MQETVDEETVEEPKQPFDEVKDEKNSGYQSQTRRKLAEEEDLMEEPPLPGVTSDEQTRKDARLRLPRPARAAIRRIHMQFGHVKKGPFMEILKATKWPPKYLEATKHYRCKNFEYTEKRPFQHNNVSMPRPYVFNHTTGMDINFVTMTMVTCICS